MPDAGSRLPLFSAGVTVHAAEDRDRFTQSSVMMMAASPAMMKTESARGYRRPNIYRKWKYPR